MFIAGVPQRKVTRLDELTDGTFFVDMDNQRLHLRADRNPDETQVEASTRPEIWIVTGAHIVTRGLRFRYAANRAQQGMAQFNGAQAVVEDCVFEWSNSTGATFSQAEGIAVRGCVFQDNGQQGFSGAHADRLHLDACTIQRNNVKDFPRGWEAGGNKMCLSRGVVYENCRFLNNHGAGVWFDISNVDCTVRNCLIADNEDAGIFYEISYGLHAHDNVIVGNGLANTKGAWGANGGICVSSSPGCVIERNLILGNEQGFCFRDQDRTAPRIDGSLGPEVAVWNHDEVVRDNLILNNRSAQVQGWFDIATERCWPLAMQTGKVKGGGAKDDVAADHLAKQDGVPAGLTLEKLEITFQGNLYAVAPNQRLFIWGANWKRHQEFKDLLILSRTLGFEGQRSRILTPLPLDMTARDFRLPAELLRNVKVCYPQGRVPGCVLGAR